MKPKIGVYLSEQIAARLAAAAKRPDASKSALVEAALAQFLDAADDADSNLSVDRRLFLMSRKLEQLDQNLRIVIETVALQARYQLAVTPPMPAAALRAACALGSERFDEFAAQVVRRVRLGTSLMQETIDRLRTKRNSLTDGLRKGAAKTSSPTPEPDLPTSRLAGTDVGRASAVREGGSLPNFPGKAGIPLH